ncbi:MAG: sulfatase-like hydrolase/transferase, partial [Candidatus Poribacteria bacterium]
MLCSLSKRISLFLICLTAILIIVGFAFSYQTENVFLVIIDGARYSETFGDETYANIPNMYLLSLEGCLNEAFYNNRNTYTKNAVCAILTGYWDKFIDFYPLNPSIWEYCRKQYSLPQELCYYSFPYIPDDPDYLGDFQPVSLHRRYGFDYWPMRGNYNSNTDSWNELEAVIENLHPKLVTLYLGDTDHEAHNGDWYKYTQSIKIADEIVGELWSKIQSDPIYQNKTTLIVTNDHGRHNNRPNEPFDGFKEHGDKCEGCQRVMFLALGPDFKRNYKTNTKQTLIDIAPTIAELLNFKAEYATGKVMTELFYEEFPDVNRDGIVNIIDLIIVCMYLGESDFPLNMNSDVNRDGMIDN